MANSIIHSQYDIKTALDHLTNVDEVLRIVAAKTGPIEFPNRTTNFESLTRIIINQQLSGKAASTIFSRLKKSFDGEITPQKTNSISDDIFTKAGVSRSKARFIRNIADKFLSNPDFIEFLKNQPDSDALNELISIKGIGQWSARVFLIFYLKRQDVFASGDATIQKAVTILYGKETLESEKSLRVLTERWSPYNSAACILLWRWVDRGMLGREEF
jgi:DNA-3-methyladenine glycosylase II